MVKQTYTTGQASEIVGMTIRNVQFYTDRGVVTPTAAHGGKGRHRQYTKESVCELAVINELAKYGIPVGVISEAIKLFDLGREASYFSLEDLPELNTDKFMYVVHDDQKVDGDILGGTTSEKLFVHVSEGELTFPELTSAFAICLTNLIKKLNF